ncbi:translation initiation factor IF-2 [Candidatus Woesearchaeota archaeon]|nr:translation initiation factor IF-2 [Candidatus Woesearchaeota archaeon]
MAIRSPLCVVLAHVDHGKTSILDQIRGSSVAAREAGGITQAIGASMIPLETIRSRCGRLLDKMNISFTIPGLLFIDTPGHASFTSLRKRGGNLADIAILVVDINEGFMPQTIESLEILKGFRTPFIVAANKIDLIPGWSSHPEGTLMAGIARQPTRVIEEFEKRLYGVVGKLSEIGFDADRFDRIDDFTKKVAVIPTSARSGEGIPELMMTVAGLAQRFLEKKLQVSIGLSGKGTILEVKEEKGLGTCLDVILYDGSLLIGDTLVVGSLGEPLVAKIKGLFVPDPLAEMRDKKSRFRAVRQVTAATGVKISATGLQNPLAGMPVRACAEDELDEVREELREEIAEVLIDTANEGIIIKAESIGSLEALEVSLKEKGIPLKKASVGAITRKDIIDAEANLEKDPLHAVILGFNVADESGGGGRAKVIANNVIYRLLEDFDRWAAEKKESMEQEKLAGISRPFKFQLLRGYIFRQNNPAVVGCEVIAGSMKSGERVMSQKGDELTAIRSMQMEQESVEKAEKGHHVAVAMDGVTVGRQICEGDILYSAVPEGDFKKLRELKGMLSADEVGVLKEIAEIRRKKNPLWGV